MPTNEPRLKVQCGPQVFGPMSLTDLAELLAAERFSGSDLVSEENGPWVTIEEYVARQSAPPSPEPPAPQTASSDDEFLCVPPPTANRQPPSPPADEPPMADDRPLFKPPEPGGPDSDYLLETESAGEAEYTPLSESLDPSPLGSGGLSSVDTDGFYRVPAPNPLDDMPPQPVSPEPAFPDAASPQPPLLPPRADRPSGDLPLDDEPPPPMADESALDDVLAALAQDEAEAPEIKPPRRKRPAPKTTGRDSPKRPRRKRKRR